MGVDQKTGVLLVNLGTPDSPETADVRKYLMQFLLDERVIDIPTVQRNLLVRFIIAPFRAPKSAALYKKIWMQEGSPLLVYSKRMADKLSAELGEHYLVELAMRYQSPSIEKGLDELRRQNVKNIIVLPLFPQYASASNGSVQQEVMRIVQHWPVVPEFHFLSSFHNDPLFISAFAANGKKHDASQYDHILFSFHGLPERQIKKSVPQNNCLTEKCCDSLHAKNQFCYRAQCFDTARLIAAQLNIPAGKYTVCFQSRLGKTPWIKPYTTDIIDELAAAGKKSILAFSPAFVADCLETIYEISVEYDTLFREKGGEKIQLVESLNEHPLWIECMRKMIMEN